MSVSHCEEEKDDDDQSSWVRDSLLGQVEMVEKKKRKVKERKRDGGMKKGRVF